jgi:hypothetical protein
MKQNQAPFPSLSGTTNTIDLVENLNRFRNCHVKLVQSIFGFEAFFIFDSVADSAPRMEVHLS